MSSSYHPNELIELGGELTNRIRDILAGALQCCDATVQEWAAAAFARLTSPDETSRPLVEAIEACLVDILSCDKAPWDTARAAFQEDLEKLELALERCETNRA